MGDLLHDVKYALRMLGRSRGLTLVAVLTLALGIGATTTAFSAVDGVLLRPLPYRDTDRLVWLWNSIPAARVRSFPLSPPEFNAYGAAEHVFSGAAAVQPGSYNLVGQGEPERYIGATATQNLFDILGVSPAVGRGFSPQEAQPGSDGVVLISHGLWQRRFGGEAGILGRNVILNERPRTVIGVMPSGFDFPANTDLWVPLPLSAGDATAARLGSQSLRTVVRVNTAMTLDAAQAQIDGIAKAFYARHPQFYSGSAWKVTLVPVEEQLVGAVRGALWVLLAAAGFVLLLACVNVAHLMLVRAAARRREVAVRLALGATRARLVRMGLMEGLLLSLAGAAAGALLAAWVVDALPGIAPGNLPRMAAVSVDARVLAFAAGLAVVTACLFGVWPAMRGARVDLVTALRQGRGSGGSMRLRGRGLLVAAQSALAVVLVVGAGLMIKSFALLTAVDPGFRPQGVLTLQLSPPRARVPTPGQEAQFYQDILERMARLPGVISAGGVSALPLAGAGARAAFYAQGQTEEEIARSGEVQRRMATPGYFQTMGIPLLRGRAFTAADDAAAAPRVAVINQSMAAAVWPGQDAVGRRIAFDRTAGPWYTVVGLVGDVKNTGLGEDAGWQIYLAYGQNSLPGPAAVTIGVRAVGDPAALAPELRRAVHQADAALPVYNVQTAERVLAASVAEPRFRTALLGAFGALALLLAAVGIYGVLAQSVTQGAHEIGVRVALGAQRSDVYRLVLGKGLLLAVLGMSAGIVASLGLARLISGMLYGVTAHDPLTYAAAAGVLLITAAASCWIPARRATRADPMVTLRHE